MIGRIVVASLTVILSGCETAGSLRGLPSGSAMSAVSCDQIYTTFGAYDRDKQSLTALAQIAGYTKTDISHVTPATEASYYENIRLSANIALAVQGCSPLSE